MRINKYLSEMGVCSRREADRLIESGEVTVNGVTASLGDQVEPKDVVAVSGKRVGGVPEKIVLALNKPIGIECTTSETVKDNVIAFVNYPERLFTIGRLDKNSEGLLLLTNDGELANAIAKARNYHEKEYVVSVKQPITKAFLTAMASGVSILDLNTVTRPCEVTQTGKRTFKIVLTQGLNRQIRRMCAALGYDVVNLKRIRVLNIQIGTLETGKWRLLSPDEVRVLREMTGANGGEES
ncbi:MAG: rRNA pseudouridine2604 synthase [Clostridiales bacterium]|jgi:23S rRNA pseudouridine2604 synthase|nr:rRNA pseudouridine2604 synthase [Clostridiales bacterium]